MRFFVATIEDLKDENVGLAGAVGPFASFEEANEERNKLEKRDKKWRLVVPKWPEMEVNLYD